VARDLFPGIADPTGRTIKIGRRHFEVVGVVEDRGTVLGNNRNQFAVIPITTYEKVFGARESVDIKVAAGDVRTIEDVRDEARFLMRMRHRLRPLEEDDFAVQTPDQLLSLWAGISKAIYGALTPLVGISLVIGGIVLMNIMLIAVTERTREIGVRKALGATRGAVLWQFLVEAMTLSLVGGILGISLGFGLAGLVALLSPLPFAFAAWAIGLGVGVTLLIGLFFGTYPAWKAACLDPVEALRYE
jgi:putative ABC transport system permease protein